MEQTLEPEFDPEFQALGLRPPRPQVVLVPAQEEHGHLPPQEWDNALFHATRGSWRLSGCAGSGKTTLLLDLAAKRIAEGMDPNKIVIIAPSKPAATMLRKALVQRLSEQEFAASDTLVRSVHSLAFSIIRAQAGQPIRLITGAEQDAVIRELLLGIAEDGGRGFPEAVHRALGMVSFARALRDFLLRAAERGIGTKQLQHYGELYNRPMWTAAGTFLAEYEQVMALGGRHNLSASELVARAVQEPLDVVDIELLLVDDAQHLDPKSGELVQLLMQQATMSVIAGDPEQSVFRFRGARPEFLTQLAVDHSVDLPHPWHHPEHHVVLFDTPSAQRSYISDHLRRQHFMEDVPWEEMAVIVRSTGEIAATRRALLDAGVPVHLDSSAIILSTQPLVASLLLVAKASYRRLSMSEVESLALGAVGGADPILLRGLIRSLRRAELRMSGRRRGLEILSTLVDPRAGAETATATGRLEAETMVEFQELLSSLAQPREMQVLEHLKELIQAGFQAASSGQSVEEVLWSIWEATGLSRRLVEASWNGGSVGSQANRDLDAVMALFDIAGDWTERNPLAKLSAFVQHVEEQELPTGMRERRQTKPEAVDVVTAHNATGKRWRQVVVAGVQESSWPALGEQSTIFGQEEFTDFIDDGIEPGTCISRCAEQLKEERRLFDLACSRATEQVLITAVDSVDEGGDAEASRFLDGYEATRIQENVSEAENPVQLRLGRHLSAPVVIAELRRALTDPDPVTRGQAARQLARLEAAGIPGANPAQWWGARGASTDACLEVFSLSPSKLAQLQESPFSVAVDKIRTTDPTQIPLIKGSLIHAFAEAVGKGADATQARHAVLEALMTVHNPSPGVRGFYEQEWSAGLERIEQFIASNDASHELLGVEVDVDIEFDSQIRVRGRIDRLDAVQGDDGEKLVRIVDFKSSTSPVTTAQATAHPQLAFYQLLMTRGQLHQDPDTGEIRVVTAEHEGLQVDQAVLVYPLFPSKKSITQRVQPAWEKQDLEQLSQSLPALLEALRGPEYALYDNQPTEFTPQDLVVPSAESQE